MPVPITSKIGSRHIARFWLPVLLCMSFIFYTSSISGKNIPGLFPYQDIVFHTLNYFLLAYFFARALKNTDTGISSAKLVIFSVIFAFIYGITDELHQAFVPYRMVSALDVFFDTLGGLLGSLSYRWQK
jgi:VanZ family protein